MNSLSARSIDVFVVVTAIVATIVWTLFAGKDMNFDQLNYHFYLPFNFLDGRLQQDFAGANGQGYLNPIAYLPFYWMVASGWHSMAVASVLAAIHSLNIVFVYLISLTCLSGREHARSLSFLAAALAFVSPIYLMEAGTTFADITSAAIVLGAIYGVLSGKAEPPWWKNRFVVAGLCFGIACGLKLSNLVFGPVFAILLLCGTPGTIKGLMRLAVFMGFAGAFGFVITHGYWSWLLWQEFGNPFFPLFSNVFPSPDFPNIGAKHERFLPRGMLDVLTLPFRMISLRGWIYIESVAPDLRFAALTCVLVVGGALALKGVSRARSWVHAFRQPQFALLLFFLISFGLWLWTSGNGRYGIVVSLLCGPVLVLMAHELIRSRKALITGLATLIGLQAVHVTNAQVRWAGEAWTPTWYEVTIPERLKKEPYLYISVGGNSNSYIFPYLARESAFTNPIGYVSFELDGPGGNRLKELISRFEGRVRVLAVHSKMQDQDPLESEQAWIRSADSMIARLGFAVDASDCEVITTAGQSNETGLDFEAVEPRRLRTCALKPRPFELQAQRSRVSAVSNAIAAWCPKLFKPSPVVLERIPTGWFANYTATDVTLIIRDDGLIFATQSRTSADIYLGTLAEWESGARPSCEALPSRPRDVYTFD